MIGFSLFLSNCLAKDIAYKVIGVYNSAVGIFNPPVQPNPVYYAEITMSYPKWPDAIMV